MNSSSKLCTPSPTHHGKCCPGNVPKVVLPTPVVPHCQSDWLCVSAPIERLLRTAISYEHDPDKMRQLAFIDAKFNLLLLQAPGDLWGSGAFEGAACLCYSLACVTG